MKILKNVGVLSVLLVASSAIIGCASDKSETSAEMKEAAATAQEDYAPTDGTAMVVETEEEVTEEDSAEPEPEISSKAMYVTVRALNVRSGPGTDNDKVKSVSFGEQVDVSEVNDGWAQIGDDEYVSAKYLSASKPAPRPTVSATVDTLGEAIMSEDEDDSADEAGE